MVYLISRQRAIFSVCSVFKCLSICLHFLPLIYLFFMTFLGCCFIFIPLFIFRRCSVAGGTLVPLMGIPRIGSAES